MNWDEISPEEKQPWLDALAISAGHLELDAAVFLAAGSSAAEGVARRARTARAAHAVLSAKPIERARAALKSLTLRERMALFDALDE